MPKINQEEYMFLKNLDDKWKWIARDDNYGGSIFCFREKPHKDIKGGEWGPDTTHYKWLGKCEILFQFIKWEDREPYNIQELIDEYLDDEYGYFNMKLSREFEEFIKKENEGAEMKKGIEWLKREIHKELESWYGVEGGIDGDGINEIMLLINQFEESEVKRLDRKMKELESYNDELIRDNNQLRNELDSLDSQFMGLHTSYDEQIKSLEYELFVEKTRDSTHKFYWFTAKKIPLIVDISYMSNENHFYGFKQVPNYSFIENHDLRFITNCSLDDLAEQFR